MGHSEMRSGRHRIAENSGSCPQDAGSWVTAWGMLSEAFFPNNPGKVCGLVVPVWLMSSL